MGIGVSRMVVTEVEYLFSVCRSIYDLLQEIASALWENILLHDSSVNKKSLKKKFSEMIEFKGRKSTQEELSERFGLPQSLVDYYMRNAKFFMTLRDFRNNIVHHGSQVQSIFSVDTGFFIQHSLKPFSNMDIWRDEERQANNLVPLIPALSVVIHNTLSACEDFTSTIEKVIQFPPPIVPGMRFFMRGSFNQMFSAALRDANNRVTKHSTENTQAPLPVNTN